MTTRLVRMELMMQYPHATLSLDPPPILLHRKNLHKQLCLFNFIYNYTSNTYIMCLKVSVV